MSQHAALPASMHHPELMARATYPASAPGEDPVKFECGPFTLSTTDLIPSRATTTGRTSFLKFYQRHVLGDNRDVETDSYDPGGSKAFGSERPPSSAHIDFSCPWIALVSSTYPDSQEVIYPAVRVSARGLTQGGEIWRRGLCHLPLLSDKSLQRDGMPRALDVARGHCESPREGSITSAIASAGDDVRRAAADLAKIAYDELVATANDAVQKSGGRLQILSLKERDVPRREE